MKIETCHLCHDRIWPRPLSAHVHWDVGTDWYPLTCTSLRCCEYMAGLPWVRGMTICTRTFRSICMSAPAAQAEAAEGVAA